jgi:PhnB protein
MGSTLNPYLSFRTTAREAMTFYQTVFGGELAISTFGEFGMADAADAGADLVMHAQLTGSQGFVLMGSDTPDQIELTKGSDYTVSLSGDDEAELRGYWDALADGGTVTLPLEKAPWGDSFGQLTDRFGTQWMVNIAGSGDDSGEGTGSDEA